MAAFSLPARADRVWVFNDRFQDFHVVVSPSAPEPELLAARRFVEHWRLTTDFEIQSSAEAVTGAVNVWIGSAAQRAFPEEFAVRKLSPNGALILTLPRRSSSDATAYDLLLAGGGPRGTLVAEWAFFERFLGARAYAPGILHFPKPHAGIPAIDWQKEPVFEYRDSNYRAFLENPWLASLNDLNGQWSNVPDRFGGHIGFVHGLAGHGHTFHHFVSPDEYFGAHPEYFAEIEGERIKDAQLCLTNPNVLAITIDRARRYLREAAPDERILSVSQMDYFWFDSWCTCAQCSAVDEEEGSHSGTIIRFVNAVAEAVEDEFPDALIDTFAYLYSRTPPKLTRPRDNVLIRLCAIEADYGRPLHDRRSPDNRVFVRDLKAWRKIAKHLYVWDYTQNWRAFQAPHPNLRVLQPNLELYAKIGVDGVFEQASPFSPHSDFEFLKAYLIGRGLRDPEFDGKRETAEFIDAYYGEAAPFIVEYQRLLGDRLRAWGGPLYFVNDLEWLDAATVLRAQEIFTRAFAVTKDETAIERLRSAYLPVQYAALVCPPNVAQTPDAYVFTRPPSQTFDEYWDTARVLGVTHLNDHPIDQFRQRLNGQTPVRHEIVPIEKLRNDRFEIWIVPTRGGAIVRWRELATGRDWLPGYDNIRSASGRIQVLVTTDTDRWAEPEPIDEKFEIIEQSNSTITLETHLVNGIAIRQQIDLIGEGIETHLSLHNASLSPVIPRVSIAAEFPTNNLRRPSMWTREVGGGTSSRAIRVSEDDHLKAIALRFAGIGKTIAAEVVEGGSGDLVTMKLEPNSHIAEFTIDLDSVTLVPGESRTIVTRLRISALRPEPLLTAPRP